MTRKSSRNYSLSVAVPLLAVWIALVAIAALAQMPGAGQQPIQHAVVSLHQGPGAHAQALERKLSPRIPNGQRDSAIRTEKEKPGATSLDQNLPMFLPAVTYDWGKAEGEGVIAAIADVNGDTHPDLIVTTSNPYQVGVLLNNGDGTFQPVVWYSVGGYYQYSPIGVAIADVNGDGKPDLVVAVGWDGVVLLLGNGNGTFQPPITLVNLNDWANAVAVADVNGDGHPDVVVASACNPTDCAHGSVWVLLGHGDGSFQTPLSYNSGGYWANSVALADVNGDGHPDVVVANQCESSSNCDSSSANGAVGVLLGNGDGTFHVPVTYSSGGQGGYSVAVADLNGNGHPDVVVANECGVCDGNGDLALGVLMGNGDGTFQAPVTYNTGGYFADSVAVADLDGDGKPDLAVGMGCPYPVVDCGWDGVLGVLLGNGDGTFQAPVTYDSGGQGYASVAVADVNGDGLPDLVAGNFSSVGVLLHVGDIPTTTVETSSPNPSAHEQPLTLTATVSSSSGTPIGTVVFYDRSNLLGSATLTNGSGAISISSLSVGSHLITTVYQGSVKFRPSASSPLTQVVTIENTATSIAPSRNPVSLNKPVKYLATVTGQYSWWPTGSVTFADGGVVVATETLTNNRAVYSTSYTTRGSHVMTAAYSGDSSYAGSTSPPVAERVKGFATKTVVTTSGSPSMLGQPVTFTANVTSAQGTIPDGELVTFYAGKTVLASVALAKEQAACTTSTLSAGKHTIKVAYPGDNTFEPSSGTVQQAVQK